ncbi:MAG: hypothetical protein J6C91_06295, partial [Muribaculaceae bacterium]|nr:hypothetical protein [Muribaculaceae bacterium]
YHGSGDDGTVFGLYDHQPIGSSVKSGTVAPLYGYESAGSVAVGQKPDPFGRAGAKPAKAFFNGLTGIFKRRGGVNLKPRSSENGIDRKEDYPRSRHTFLKV